MMMRIRPRADRLPDVPRLEESLRAIGVHPVVAEQLSGDLVETYQHATARDGALRARIHLAGEILRSLPYLAWSIMRDGGPAERARLAAFVTGLALVGSSAVATVAMQKGPPAQLLFGGASVSKIVVNHLGPAQLPLRVVDDRGRKLDSTRIDYRWIAGAPLSVSPGGVVTCGEAGDAVVRASAGGIEQQLLVRCRPVRNIEASTWVNLVVGDGPQELSFQALGFDGRPVTELRGALRVRDSSIANLSGVMITPVKAGETDVFVGIGESTARIRVLVHERVTEFTRLRPQQRLVAVPIRLAQGDTVRFALPSGVYWVKYVPRDRNAAPPTMSIAGWCNSGEGGRLYRLQENELAWYCRIYGGNVMLGHGFVGAEVVEGVLALEVIRQEPR